MAEIKSLSDEGVISALAAASREQDPYLANVLATEALNRTRQSHLITSTLREAVIGLDSRGRVTFVNAAALAVTGYAQTDVVGKRLEDSVFAGRAKAAARVLDVLETRRATEAERNTFTRKEGEAFPVTYNVSPVVREGLVEGAVLVFREASDRKPSDTDGERDVNARLRLAAQATNDIVWDWDVTTDRLWWSPNLEAAFGHDMSEAGTRTDSWSRHIHPDDRGRILSSLNAFLASDRQSWTDEYRFRHADGTCRHVLDRGYVMRDASGRPRRMIGSMMDITFRKRTEEGRLDFVLRERQARSRAEATARRMTMLADAGAALAAAADEAEALDILSAHAVPAFADWCVVDVTGEDGIVQRRRVAHADPARAAIADTLEAAAPYDPATEPGVLARVLRTGEPELVEVASPDRLSGSGGNTLKPLADVGLRSAVAVPLRTGGRVLGAVLLATAESGRTYGDEDHDVALALAARGAPALAAVRRLDAERAARERAEAALAEQKGRHAKTRTLTRVGGWEWDVAADRVSWSDGLDLIFGVRPGELPATYEAFMNFVVPDERDYVNDIVRTAVEEGGDLDFEHRIVRPDGEERTLHCRGEVIRDTDGLPVRLVGISQDVTEQKAAEVALERVVARFTATLESTADGILVVDRDGRITHFNRNFVEMCYVPDTALEGGDLRTLAGFVSNLLEDPTRCEERVMRVTSHPEEEAREVIAFKDGRVFELVVKPQRMDGEYVGQVWSFRDVTERLNTERELRAHRDRLGRVTRELAAANRELEAFSYSVSHDLRGPLRGIDYLSQALLEDHAENLDAEGRDNLKHLRDASRRLMQLVTDLLAFARVTRDDVEYATVDLSALASSVLEELARREPERRVDVHVDEGLVVQGDPRLLRVALENLLGNAWKFTGRTDAPTIVFGATEHDGTRTFFIKDNGAGFDPARAEALFTPFQRLHPDTEFDGTGVGLATVERIIDRHGGRIWADGAPGKGATFSFTIP